METSQLAECRSHFEQVAALFGGQLAQANGHVVALAAKWRKADLIPGLSDMDFRIICDDRTTVDDWVEIDRAMGPIHLEMVRAHPEWNRINEHPAGAGMTVAEVMDERFYNPEYAVWDLWWGRGEWFDDLKSYVGSRPFSRSDEHAHVSKFLAYYSPYIHGIDPAHNLGEFESKYPLHSRCWHYFAPPMLSAACVLAGRNFPGKLEGLGWLRDNGFIPEHVQAVLAQVEAHYQTPELESPQRLAAFEEFLFTAFEQIYQPMCEAVRYLDVASGATPEAMKAQLSGDQSEPVERFMESLRWARTRAGRYYFYANPPEHFSATHFMVAELNWARKLTAPMFDILCDILDAGPLSPKECLSRLGMAPTAEERRAMAHLFEMSAWSAGENVLPEMYRKAANLFPHYYRLLEKALAAIL